MENTTNNTVQIFGGAEGARAYLERARRYADRLNGAADADAELLDTDHLAKLAEVNALVALAAAFAPAESTVLKG